MIPEIALIAALNVWIAWRYSRQPIGPDESTSLMWGMTGSRPYVDHEDFFPPGLATWLWLLSRLSGRNLRVVKLLHHLTMGALIILAMVLSGSLAVGLMATTFLQGARLFGFQSWIDATPAVLLLIAFTLPPWLGIWVVGLAVLFNFKAALPGFVFMAAMGAWGPLLAATGLVCLVIAVIVLFFRPFGKTLWFNLSLSARMRQGRRQILWNTWLSIACMIAGMDIGICLFLGHPPLPVLLAALSYTVLELYGRAWRPNHFMPLVVLSLALPDPFLVGLVFLGEFASSNLYLGYVWATVYGGIANSLLAARYLGEKLKSKVGSLWVNTWHPEIYIYAQKPPAGCMIEYIEFDRGLMPELLAKQDAQFKEHPPTWVVQGDRGHDWEARGYTVKFQIEDFYLLE